MRQILRYTPVQVLPQRSVRMPKKREYPLPGFGERLAQLRKRAGYTQVELAAELGTSQRMTAYYESRSAPPAALIPPIAQVLEVSADELLGLSPVPKRRALATGRTQRRLQQLEKLDSEAQRQVWQLVDVLVERERLKRQVQTA
jgi:transcriptional regulator with XRE-family HTH domain